MDDFATIQQAATLMGVSRWTLWRLVKEGRLQTYHSDANRRVKLVRRADVEALMVPKPIAADES